MPKVARTRDELSHELSAKRGRKKCPVIGVDRAFKGKPSQLSDLIIGRLIASIAICSYIVKRVSLVNVTAVESVE